MYLLRKTVRFMRTRPTRLLVVEDSSAYLFLIKRAFRARDENQGWELTVARDGAEAERLMRQHLERARASTLNRILPASAGDLGTS